MTAFIKKIPIILFVSFIVCTGQTYAKQLKLFSPKEQQWLRDHRTITMVVTGGPHPISIWAGPNRQNSFSQEQALQGPAGRPPPMAEGPDSRMPPAPGRSFGFPQRPPSRQGFGQSSAALVKVTSDEQHYFQGLSADYLKEVADLTGIKFITTFYAGYNMRAAVEALNRGEADLAPAVMQDHPRDSFYHLSAPYFQTPIVVVMRSNAPPLEDISRLNTMKVAGLMSIPPKLRELGLNYRIQTTTPPNGLRGVAVGRFDAFLGERAILADEFHIAQVRNIKIAGQLPVHSAFCVAVSPRMVDFIPILNKAIAAIAKKKKEAIQQQWLGGLTDLNRISYKTATPVAKEKNREIAKTVSSEKAESSPAANKTATALVKDNKEDLQQKTFGGELKKQRTLPKIIWPIGLAGAAVILLGGLWLFFYRKRLQDIRHGIAALEPHLLCVHIDENITITGVTEAICDATGFSEEELMGKSLHVLGAPPVGGKARLVKLLDTVAQGQTWRGEAKLSRKDGTEIWTDVIISPSRRKNDTIGYSIIYQDASKRKHYEKLAIRDELTGLYNRRHFNALAPNLLHEAVKEGFFFGLFLLDVDNFKKYNDFYGHPAGDDVLASIGKTLKDLLKRDDDLCFRLGGEEFGVIVLFTAHEDAVTVARKILTSVRKLNIEHKHNPPGIVTVSLGVALTLPTDGAKIDDIYKQADTCLYEAKQTGRNRCVMSRAKGQGKAEVVDGKG